MVAGRCADLVLPASRKCGGGPIGGAVERVLSEDIEDALLLARAEFRHIDRRRCVCARGGEFRRICVNVLVISDVAVLFFNGQFFGLRKSREGRIEVVPKVLKRLGSRWTERNPFIGHISREDAFALEGLGEELLAYAILDKRAIDNRKKGECTKWPGLGNFGTGVLEDYSIGITETLECIAGCRAAYVIDKIVVCLGRLFVVMVILEWHPWTGSDEILKEGFLLSATICHCLVENCCTTSTFPCNSDLGCVTPKFTNVALHPLERKVHVKQSGVEGTMFFDMVTRKESKSTQSILDDDADKTIVVGGEKLGGIEASCAEQAVAPSV